MSAAEEYMKSYSSFSGVDIVAGFNGKVFAELQGITYSISREKAPIYTMGSAEPRAFCRGKRGIAGTLVFTVFDRDALIAGFTEDEDAKDSFKIQKAKMNDAQYVMENTKSTTGFTSIEEWDNQMSGLISKSVTGGEETSNFVDTYVPHYADEIPPFDITLCLNNEYGNRATMVIYGVEILNEGSGFSTDTMVTEKAYTYVARRIKPITSLGRTGSPNFASSW